MNSKVEVLSRKEGEFKSGLKNEKSMKGICLLFFSLFVCCHALTFSEESTICLNMIVKDESHVIKRCLESVKPLIDHWVIVDTGSSDNTKEIIKELMKDIPGELHERPWIDFAHNRNEALELAAGKADYLFFLDADDVVKLAPGFCKKKLSQDNYLIVVENGDIAFGRPALVKSGLSWRWKGVVREVITCNQLVGAGTWPEVAIQIVGGGNRSLDTEKFLKDAALLEKAVQEDPNDPQRRFFLAESYRDAGKLEASMENYEKRAAMGGGEQEVFWSLYQIAGIKEFLNKNDAEILKAYTAAYLHSQTRLEPLYRICAYYRSQENYLMGYLVGSFGVNAFALEPCPPDSYLKDGQLVQSKNLELRSPCHLSCIELSIYDFAFLLEYSICAQNLGRFQEAEAVTQYLLKNSKYLRKDIKDNYGSGRL